MKLAYERTEKINKLNFPQYSHALYRLSQYATKEGRFDDAFKYADEISPNGEDERHYAEAIVDIAEAEAKMGAQSRALKTLKGLFDRFKAKNIDFGKEKDNDTHMSVLTHCFGYINL